MMPFPFFDKCDVFIGLKLLIRIQGQERAGPTFTVIRQVCFKQLAPEAVQARQVCCTFACIGVASLNTMCFPPSRARALICPLRLFAFRTFAFDVAAAAPRLTSRAPCWTGCARTCSGSPTSRTRPPCPSWWASATQRYVIDCMVRDSVYGACFTVRYF
jgi:hypothetical protein